MSKKGFSAAAIIAAMFLNATNDYNFGGNRYYPADGRFDAREISKARKKNRKNRRKTIT